MASFQCFQRRLTRIAYVLILLVIIQISAIAFSYYPHLNEDVKVGAVVLYFALVFVLPGIAFYGNSQSLKRSCGLVCGSCGRPLPLFQFKKAISENRCPRCGLLLYQ